MPFNIEDYKDIEPLPITTGLPDELCEIMYTDNYKQIMGIARALVQKKEYSARALQLTSEVIGMAPAFYTIWNYRYDIVKWQMETHSNVPELLNNELSWLDEITLNNPKNYQIWSYRQSILKIHPSPSFKLELPILQMMIDDDTKNYHVWSYRKWCLLLFQDFSNELSYTDTLIQRDVYNNSAWAHRMFVLKSTAPSGNDINDEINYVKEKIELVPQNISVWTYLRGLYEYFRKDVYDEEIIKFAETFTNNVFDLKTLENLPPVESSYAIEFLSFVYSKNEATQYKSITGYKALSEKYDPVRVGLWDHKIKRIQQGNRAI